MTQGKQMYFHSIISEIKYFFHKTFLSFFNLLYQTCVHSVLQKYASIYLHLFSCLLLLCFKLLQTSLTHIKAIIFHKIASCSRHVHVRNARTTRYTYVQMHIHKHIPYTCVHTTVFLFTCICRTYIWTNYPLT